MYPIELIGVPLLMLSDYYLTLLGNNRNIEYSKHIKAEKYELNPKWQDDVEKNRWINKKHLARVLLTSTFFYLIFISADVRVYHWSIGFYYTVFGIVNGRHLSNLFTFNSLNRFPEQLYGEIHMTQIYTLRTSQYRIIAIALPIMFLTLFTQNAYVVGGLSSCIYMFFSHQLWIHKYKTQLMKDKREIID